jgi:tetratricopeptide (TPR) repeat protein
MNETTLEAAVDEIRQACEAEPPERTPFFFLVGAGISAPSIPLAQAITNECESKARNRNPNRQGPNGSSPMQGYSHWMQQAFPQPAMRQRYLRELMERSPISLSNYLLAHLLSEKKVASMVVTPNFDNLLSRALSLFGVPHVTCDHPGTVERIDSERPDVQLLHVHGTFWFYDCCNLTDEIADRTQVSPLSSSSISEKLHELLSRRSPIVVGYSGWEGDVLTKALKRRLQGRLGTKLYWFCYSRADAELVPAEIRNHRDVMMVLPQVPTVRTTSLAPVVGGVQGELQAAQMASAATAELREERLAADRVFRQLLTAFNCEAPLLTRDPLGFFADQLKESLPRLSGEEGAVFFFDAILRRVEEARSWDRQNSARLELLEQVRDAMRRGRYSEAVDRSRALVIPDLPPRQLRELVDAMAEAARHAGSAEALAVNERLLELVDALERSSPQEPELDELAATSFLRRMSALHSLNRNEEVARLGVEAQLRRFMSSTALEVQRSVLLLSSLHAAAMGRLGRYGESAALYHDVIQRFSAARDPELLEIVDLTRVDLSSVLLELGQVTEALALCEEMLARTRSASDTRARAVAGLTLSKKAALLASLGRTEEALAACDELLSLGEVETTWGRNLEEIGLITRAELLASLGRYEDGLADCVEVVRRGMQRPELDRGDLLSLALAIKGMILSALGRNEEALTACREAIACAPEANEEARVVVKTYASLGMGAALLETGRNEEALRAIDDSIQGIGDAPGYFLRACLSRALANKAYALVNLWANQEALDASTEAIKLARGFSGGMAVDTEVSALLVRGVALGRVDRPKESLDAYDEARSYLERLPTPRRAQLAPKIQLGRAMALNRLGRREEVLSEIDGFLRTADSAPELVTPLVLSEALLYRAAALVGSRRFNDALTTIDEALSPGTVHETTRRELRFLHAAALTGLGRFQEAFTLLGELRDAVEARSKEEAGQGGPKATGMDTGATTTRVDAADAVHSRTILERVEKLLKLIQSAPTQTKGSQ